jgi:DNA processing protein
VSSAVTTELLPPEAWATVLVSLDGMGPARLRALLDQHPNPHAAWVAVASGRLRPGPALAGALGARAREVLAGWQVEAAALDPAVRWAAHLAKGVGVVLRGNRGYPGAFDDDPDPPSILFHAGDPDVIAGSRVAIVGTRDCTRTGHEIAFELGAELSAAGVAVVSGLALGIDGAAHAGALQAGGAPPIAVVGSGLDVVYPRRNGPLWRQVARRGVVLSEYPLGAPAQAWHFPARNRLIAALADVVVVVESHGKGGALLTAEEALDRDRPVLVVPGPVRSPASAGCHRLLAEYGPVGIARDVSDVLLALRLEPGSRRVAAERRPAPPTDDVEMLEAMAWQPVTLEQLVLRTGRSLVEVAAALTRLELDGWVAARGGWYERVARSDA